MSGGNKKSKVCGFHRSALAILDEGNAPIRMEPVVGMLGLRIKEPQSAKVYLLDLAGRCEQLIRGTVQNGELVLPLPGEHKALFYGITR